jgi:hypothetical protein
VLHSDRVSLAAFPETAGTAAPAESLRNSNIASTLAERQPGSDSHRYDTCPPILHLNSSQLRQVENRVDAQSALGAARPKSDSGRGGQIVLRSSPAVSRSLGAGSTRVPIELC